MGDGCVLRVTRGALDAFPTGLFPEMCEIWGGHGDAARRGMRQAEMASPCSPQPPPPKLLAFTLQVTMEEEDESRGKTEESSEDRADAPPDRDPPLPPSAFILVRWPEGLGLGKKGLRGRTGHPCTLACR